MLIKRLEVKGFKSLKDVVWEPGPLTILIGPNGSGKTNLLLSISLLQSIASGHLEKFVYTHGGITQIAWDGLSPFLEINTTIEFNIFESLSNIHYSLQMATHPLRFRILREVCVEEHFETSDQKTIHDVLIQRIPGEYKISDHDGLEDVSQQALNIHESLLSIVSTPYHSNSSLYMLSTSILRSTIYSNINVDRQDTIRKPQVVRYNKSLDSDGQNLVNVLHTLYSENRDFENDINTAMRAAFGDDFGRLVFPPAADQLVQLRIRWKSLKREQSMLDLSDGTIRFLFLMTVLCNPEPPSLIAIDEPETGLHPSMFPIIAEYAAEASKRTQVIFSTHSPQFLDAFGEYNPTTTVTVRKDGETKIKNLDGDTLKQWLEHYSLGTLFLSGDLEALA
ncbi:MAG: AAA family ATPase [Solidesulfovibrio sp.]|uniref:AAA family ATPase n=1 Tax=Solidesulfovibrio sp. TaxID=2910990 RepID=UPI002B21959D|nr:AAA family ATPase [Solidesulfovibrio sp.]MEA4855166.1 AAA family ATPase [Solidesulfovibrio sp.]